MSYNSLSVNFANLSHDLSLLASSLRALTPRAAYVAPITPTLRGAENDPTSHIVVSVQSGQDAINSAAQSYLDLHIDPELSQKASRRSVGIIWLSPTWIGRAAADNIKTTVERINTTKAAIEDFIISNYQTRHERFEALRAECPGVMTLHLYRQIRCYAQEDLSSIRFSWQRKDSLKKPNKNELVKRLQEELDRSGPTHRYPLELLLQKVIDTPEHLLRERREVKVQPVANIMAAGALKTVTAPLPIIVIQDNPLKIGMLRDFDASEQRRTRSDKTSSTLLGMFAGVAIEAIAL
ncbi:DNA replication terminus site-binding protein (plasmid) [Edwardsiella tarda]|uniref:DNA replication terminus site-binding protein n=1 Tax=Edwardsiella tarda TaxID=636 RepID=UPI00351C657F